ncbi:BPSS1780 family membrane protein [Photorhabdus sp. SF281]|uniref:BPSS1780 family membrane protein n=1 Tax=Photorhabdus sp. SF281 TaxID=3459527 RepID=UPI0040441AFE
MDNQNLNFNSDVIPDNQEVFIPGGQSLHGVEGVNWISQAWELVKSKLGMWILLSITYLTIIAIPQFIPFLSIFAVILRPVFLGGIIAVCEKQRTTGKFKLSLLFNGFHKNFASLLGVGILSLGIMLLSAIAMLIISGNAMIHILLATQHGELSAEMLEHNLSALLLGAFTVIIFSFITTALTWFAPALIIIHNLKFGTAVSMSLGAVKKNLLPGFLFFNIIGVIFTMSTITLGLGFLIAIPIFLVSNHSSYRSIFIGKEKSSNLFI